MYRSAEFQGLLIQLQARFPNSSLMAELVQIHEGSFVVRAVVEIGKIPLVSAMAAASSVEIAEDQARWRVLQLLGIVATGEVEPPLSAPTEIASPLPSIAAPSEFPSPFSSAIAQPDLPQFGDVPPPIDPVPKAKKGASGSRAIAKSPSAYTNGKTLTDLGSLPDSLPQNTPAPDYSRADYLSEDYSSVSYSEISSEPSAAFLANQPYYTEFSSEDFPGEESAPPREVQAEPTGKSKPASTQTTKEKASDKKAIAPPISSPSVDSEEPVDLSSLIALTDIEMDRIGWTKQEGREYLKQTYSKSTRQKLDVGELMDFLNYLRALPSLNGLEGSGL